MKKDIKLLLIIKYDFILYKYIKYKLYNIN